VLDVYIHERDIHLHVSNDAEGIRKLLGRLNRYQVQRIVVEATGRLEREVVSAALEKGFLIIVVNPLHVQCYAGAIGLLAKTDKLDAKLIAQYAAMIKTRSTRQIRPGTKENQRPTRSSSAH